MSEQPFRRRQAAWPVRCAIGIATDAIAAPFVWATDKLGHGDALFRMMRKPEARRLAKCRPFGEYPLGGRDIVVMVYLKSGTNWTMQIAHQLLHHGEAEFYHIHDVVAWPDSRNHFPMRITPFRSKTIGERLLASIQPHFSRSPFRWTLTAAVAVCVARASSSGRFLQPAEQIGRNHSMGKDGCPQR